MKVRGDTAPRTAYRGALPVSTLYAVVARMEQQRPLDTSLDRTAIESCFLDIVRVVAQHNLPSASEAALAAVFMGGAIHSALEDAAKSGDVTAQRAALLRMLGRLQRLAEEWARNEKSDITDALLALGATAAEPSLGDASPAVLQ